MNVLPSYLKRDEKMPKPAPPIVKAEQTKPNSRQAKRQAEREAKRKHKIKYAERRELDVRNEK